LSRDQQRVVEEHLALPDERRTRPEGGICFVYRKRRQVPGAPPGQRETFCFDRKGKLVAVTGG
jgi:hypothetical protein